MLIRKSMLIYLATNILLLSHNQLQNNNTHINFCNLIWLDIWDNAGDSFIRGVWNCDNVLNRVEPFELN